MKHFLVFTLLFTLFSVLSAQPDSLMQGIRLLPGDKAEKIAQARLYLRDAFAAQDLGAVNAWLGFLQTELDDDSNAATLSDERWLLYFWTGQFSLLFEEAAQHLKFYYEKYQYQQPPPEDDLFALVDRTSFDHQYVLYGNLRKGLLSEEEQAFGVILLDYLLRLDANKPGKEAMNDKIEAFLKKFPDSRFRKYLRDEIYDRYKVSNSGFVGDLAWQHDRQTNVLGVNLRPGNSVGLSLGYWKNRMSYSLRGQFGSSGVRRTFQQGDYVFSPDSSASVFELGLESTYALAENNRVRIAPAAGLGWSFLGIPFTPEFYDDYVFKIRFNSPYWNAGLVLDLFPKKPAPGEDQSNWAIRVRVGYKGLFYGQDNPELLGSHIYIGVGASIFGRTAEKRL